MNREETILKAMDRHDVERHTGAAMPEDDNVQVGDVVHNHYGKTDAPVPPAGGSGGLLKMALGAALVATGAGAAYGLPLLLDGGKDVIKDKPEIRYLLDLSGGEEIKDLE